MRRVRGWLLAAFVWPWVVALIDRFWGPLDLASFVCPAVALVALPVVVTPLIERISTAWLALVVLPVMAVAKVSLGDPGTDAELTATLLELLVIGVALFIVCELGRGILVVDRAVRDFVIPDLAEGSLEFKAGQERLYQELRRARRYGRDLSVMALSVEPDSVRDEAVEAALLMELQRSNLTRYADAQIGALLADETNGCQIVTRRNGHFLVLLPETDAEGMEALAKRLRERARTRLGVTLCLGSASFPQDEVTLARLVESAEAEMAGTAPPAPPEAERPPRPTLSDASLSR